ncbi:hypothetical protein LY11_01946 [Pedobacter cryoconitis]|uniref:Uncharacterized protein n=1 Tax=Pedobacter cryoconitis TaxID=188932 RepID=A0A327SXP4_9SPHI|nr:hypothetical protein LY11_01946 [Pedobacter cryoconitis]
MQISKRYSLIFYHFIFWVFYFSLYAVTEFVGIPDTYFFSFPDIFVTQFPGVIIVYLSIFLFFRYTIPNKPIPLVLGILAIHLVNCMVWEIIKNYITPPITGSVGLTAVRGIWPLSILPPSFVNLR